MSISKFLEYIYLEKKSSHHTKIAYNSNKLVEMYIFFLLYATLRGTCFPSRANKTI